MLSNLPQFCEGALLGAFLEQKEGKITYENRCQVLHVAHNIQVLARYKVENHFYWEGVGKRVALGFRKPSHGKIARAKRR